MADYLSPLNPEQLEAVRHEGSSLLILAGAGSGKTRVITTKIAYLIREQGIAPESILAVTFTNKAAREMAERACAIEPRAERAVLKTFHSFGAWFLRRNGALHGLNDHFVIYDDDDSTSLLSNLVDLPRNQVSRLTHLIARAKDYFLNPDDAGLIGIDHREEFREAYRLYEERLREIGNVDFGDLIKRPVELLRQYPEVRDRFRQRFRVVLVDEYQDSNVAQFELLKELCGPTTYLCVVGDDDQSIYRFRGAEVRNILDFPDRFPGTDVIRLERNYRSSPEILAVAGAVVDHNEGRLGKTLRAERASMKKPTVIFLEDQEAEAGFCAELVDRSMAADVRKGAAARYADWAILYRTNAQSLGFETEFLRRKIPYRVVGSLKFYEREEIKDALALLALSMNPRDEVAFRRMVNKPARGVGPASIDRILASANGIERDLLAAARAFLPSLSAKARAGLSTFLSVLEAAKLPEGDTESGGLADAALSGIFGDAADGGDSEAGEAGAGPEGRLLAGEGLSPFVVRLVVDSGLADYYRAQDELDGTQRIANLQELANAASLYPASAVGLTEFLERIELDRAGVEEDDGGDRVSLITFHNTKGLEFRRVVMTGLEQGIFPREDKRDEELEEERRLFYVGATRAMDELYLCSCAQRRLYGRTQSCEPSLFLREIPSDTIRVLGRAPAGFGAKVAPAASGLSSKASSDGLWRVGGRLFHDDYGYGAITAVSEGEEGPVVCAHFETGREVRFLPRYQAGSFTRIADDD